MDVRPAGPRWRRAFGGGHPCDDAGEPQRRVRPHRISFGGYCRVQARLTVPRWLNYGLTAKAAGSIDQLRLFEPEGLRYPGSVGRIRAPAIVDVPLLDVQLGVAHRPRRVLAPQLLLRRRHLPEQISRLFPM